MSLFATLVEELLSDDPDLEDAFFKIYDLSAPGQKYERGLVITDLRDIPKLTNKEKLAMLEILQEGYAMADEQKAKEQRQRYRQPESPDPNQYPLWN